MLNGKELGKAIKEAIDLKIASGAVKSKAEIARHFGIKPPSIHDWIKRGVIAKDKLPELFAYFSDVVGPDHWGIGGWFDMPANTEQDDHDNTPAARDEGAEERGKPAENMLFDPAGLTRSQRELLEAIITSLPAMDDDTAGAIKTIALNSSKEKQRG